MNDTQTGIVLVYQSNFYTVKSEDSYYQCFLRGMLKKEATDVLVGDRVIIDNVDNTNNSARIAQVLPRENQLARPKIANITGAMVVASVKMPTLDLQQLDRYVTHVFIAGVSPMICFSKADLVDDLAEIAQIEALYTALSIPVYRTSIRDVTTVQQLFQAISGQTVVLAGMSGVGKSSLINAFSPEKALMVQEVSEKIQRGQHTTRHVSLLSVSPDTYVADAPGFSYLKFDTVSPTQIESAFPEFAPYRNQCRFQDCLHLDESDCDVKTHIDMIAASRYQHYQLFQTEAALFLENQQMRRQKTEYGYKTLQRGKATALQVLKLSGKQRETSRRTKKQQIQDWAVEDEDGTLDP